MCGAHRDRAHRDDGEVGWCGVGGGAELAYWGPHFGEEPALTGEGGVGNLFFVGCNLGCPYCQNHQISHRSRWGSGRGPKDAKAVEDSKVLEGPNKSLVSAHLAVEEQGCQNVGWVTPTHVVPQAVEALFQADAQGFRLPLVYNTSGYETTETLRLLEGIVDIYVPDLKYGPEADLRRVRAPEDYFQRASEALKTMWAQVGPLKMDETGAALEGVLVRHLVLPGGVADTGGVLVYLSQTFGHKAWLSLMSQYAPPRDLSPELPPPLHRPLTKEEYESAVEALDRSAVRLGWVQGLDAKGVFNPDFFEKDPFGGSADPREGGGGSHEVTGAK
mgnify:CR=1 FL=1